MDAGYSTLEDLCRQAYGAYEYLRDNDLSAESGTSKRLRAGNIAKLQARLAEELLELRGVIEGTHRHEGFDQDIVLEGYEVFYWAVSVAVAINLPYSGLQPHVHLASGFAATALERKALLAEFDQLAAKIQTQPEISELTKVFYLIGQACALNGTPPARLIERDLSEMRQKAYLANYWS